VKNKFISPEVTDIRTEFHKFVNSGAGFFISKTTTAFMILLIAACANPVKPTIPPNDSLPYNTEEAQLISRLKNDLPGYYSNFTQVVEAGGVEQSATDLTIRELITEGNPVFLFETHSRSTSSRHYDLYWPQINPFSRSLELQFTRISGSELSATVPESLATAKQRALPGCLIEILVSGTQMQGQTQPETCRFENPAHGESRLYRSVVLGSVIDGSNSLDITSLELEPGETADEDIPPMRFQKHQAYIGSISISPDVISEAIQSDQWQESTAFNLHDDGRIAHMLDTDMNKMDYTIKLSRQHWRENEPAYLRLEVIQVKTGEIMAYSWFKPDSEIVEFDSDWVKVDLKLNKGQGIQ
jgi:hypothetical protein